MLCEGPEPVVSPQTHSGPAPLLEASGLERVRATLLPMAGKPAFENQLAALEGLRHEAPSRHPSTHYARQWLIAITM